MRIRRLTVFAASAAFFTIILLTGPPSFDATDGAELAVCGTYLQVAHAPGYPLFLFFVRLFSLIFSPLYGHLRLLNAFLGAISLPVGITAFRKRGLGYHAAFFGTIVFFTTAPVFAQLNSLEVYPLAILLVLGALALKDTRLAPYASGMALFGGHPVSLLAAPLFFSVKKKFSLLLTFFIPATLYLYVPLRAGACRVAHYGHPTTLDSFWGYLSMYSGRLNIPSFERLFHAVSFVGFAGGALFLILALFGGKFSIKRDTSILLALIFLASYELPDPAGQLWILLLPLSLRSASGFEYLARKSSFYKAAAWLMAAIAITSGVMASSRRTDDVAMRWTTDVFSSLPAGCVYRPVSHDTFYAAYAFYTLGLRPDIVLSDPFGNFFEFSPPPPIPPFIGKREVYISRAWNRDDSFSLRGLVFSPLSVRKIPPDWTQMAIFRFHGSSPDPMAMDIVSEAWARRALQSGDGFLADSLFAKALKFAATPVTRSRIESIRRHI